MDLKELKEILQILEEKEITEFELEEEGMKLRIRKAGPAMPQVATLAPAAPAVMAAPPAPVVLPAGSAAAPPPSPATEASLAAPVEEEGLVVVKSPIVGTFYRTPDPNSPPFVNVGDRIRVGQVLCIIEAMKLMNEIEAELGGEIVKIHHESGQPVQFGEPLFTVRADR